MCLRDALARERLITPLPGRGCPQFANWGWEWNAGDDVTGGTGKDLIKLFVLLSLLLRTMSDDSARIPLPTRFAGHLLPGRRLSGFRR